MTSPTTGAFSGGRGSLIIRANEPWTPTAQSTYILFNTAPLGQAFSRSGCGLTTRATWASGRPIRVSPLTVAGVIQSTAGGFKFPDNTVLTSAANVTSGAGLTTTVVSGATTLGVDQTVFQKRVTGNCPSGAISQINQDGSVTCVSAGGSGGSQTGYLTAYVNTALNTLPVSSNTPFFTATTSFSYVLLKNGRDYLLAILASASRISNCDANSSPPEITTVSPACSGS